MYITAG
jgi:adenylosuccinate synthase